MKRTNIKLREYQHKALAERSEKTGATVSELIRRAIDEYLKKDNKKTAGRARLQRRRVSVSFRLRRFSGTSPRADNSLRRPPHPSQWWRLLCPDETVRSREEASPILDD